MSNIDFRICRTTPLRRPTPQSDYNPRKSVVHPLCDKMKPKIAALIGLYFVSSSALLVLNKVAISVIPNASLLLIVQLFATVLILAVVSFLGGQKFRINFRPSSELTRAYTSVAVVFLLTIYSNFRLIHVVGVNPFIVLRCTTPLLVSVLDWFFLERELPKGTSILALFGIFISGTAYTYPKLSATNVMRTSSFLKVRCGHSCGLQASHWT